MPEFQFRRFRAVRQCVRATHHAGLCIQHLRNAARTGHGFCDVQNQIGKLDEFNQNLRHVVIKRDQLALRDHALVYPDAAHAQNRNDSQIDDHIRQRIEKCGKLSDELLCRKQISGLFCEAFRFCLFTGKGADNAHAGQILLRCAGYAVKPCLHTPVERNAAEHDGKHDGKEHRNRHGEDECRFHINGKGHDHRAENHDGGAQQQPERQIKARLHLIHVARHARDERRCAEPVKFGIGQRLNVRKERMAQAARRTGRGFGGKILRAGGAGKAAQAEADQNQTFFQDIRRIAGRNANVDDIRHNERHKQFKRSLQQLEARGQDCLQAVRPQVNKQFFHERFLLFASFCHSIDFRACDISIARIFRRRARFTSRPNTSVNAAEMR